MEAWFTIVVKTKAELTEAKRFLHGPLTRFHRSLLAEIREREQRREQIGMAGPVFPAKPRFRETPDGDTGKKGFRSRGRTPNSPARF